MNSEGVTNVRSAQVRQRALQPVRSVFAGPQHVFGRATANVSLTDPPQESPGPGSADAYRMRRF